jgi:hypothetical protein
MSTRWERHTETRFWPHQADPSLKCNNFVATSLHVETPSFLDGMGAVPIPSVSSRVLEKRSLLKSNIVSNVIEL